MSKDEVMHTASTGGTKAGNDERYDLLPANPLRELARHYGIGSRKYEARNWERGYDWHLSFAALNRHLWQFWNGEDIDEPTGTKHIIAVAWHALALAEFMDTHREFDDRPTTVSVRNRDEQARAWAFLEPLKVNTWLPGAGLESVDGGTVLTGLIASKTEYTSLGHEEAASGRMFQSEATQNVYWHVDGKWWWFHPDDSREDPWEESTYFGVIPWGIGPFRIYKGEQP